MVFSEMAQILYEFETIEGTKRTNPSIFLNDLIVDIMGPPVTDKEQDKESKREYYPYCILGFNPKKDPHYDIRYRIFTGRKNFSRATFRQLFFCFKRNKGKPFIDSLTSSAKDYPEKIEPLIEKLKVYGIDCQKKNLIKTLSSAMYDLLKSYAEHDEGFNFADKQYNAGNKLSGIPIRSVAIHDGKIIIGGVQVDYSEKLTVPESINEPLENKYIGAILEAYADHLHLEKIDKSEILSISEKYQKHLLRQRKSFYDAECLRIFVRENMSSGDSEFEILEQDLFDGIEQILLSAEGSGFDRLNIALEKSITMTLSKSSLTEVLHGIGNSTRMGLCHELVNDEKIDSWVANE